MKTLKPFNNMPRREAVVKSIAAGYPEWSKRKVENAVNRRMEELEKLAKALPMNCIKIKIQWTKSRMWGNNPSWEAWAWGEDAKGGSPKFGSDWHRHTEGGKISGCGYDKQSTATASALNALLMPYLFRVNPKMFERKQDDRGRTESGLPYGFTPRRRDRKEKMWLSWNPGFDGGVGVNCHHNVIRHLGGEVKISEGGRAWDLYEFKLPPFKEQK